MNRTKATGSGIGFLGLLGLLFITLKLIGVITWSWWWVTVPLWGPTAIVIAVVLVLLILAAIVKGLAALIDVAEKLTEKHDKVRD